MNKIALFISGLFFGYVLYPLFNTSSLIPEIDSEKKIEAKAHGIGRNEEHDKLGNEKPGVEQIVSEKLVDMNEKLGNHLEANIKSLGEEQVTEDKSSITPSTEAFAKSVEIFKRTPYLKSINEKSKRMIGSFEGVLMHKNAVYQRRVDSVVMNLNLYKVNGKVEGESFVSLTDPDGFEYSKMSGNGENKVLKAQIDDPDIYYVDASPSSFFIINLKKYPEITGRYFDKGELMGTISLKKSSLE